MASVFTLLLFVTLICLIWGLISPSHLAGKVKINKQLTRKHTGLGFGVLAIVFLVLAGATAPKTVNLNSTNAAAHGSVSKSNKPVVTTKQVTETQPVNFTTTDENDSSLAKGQTQVKQAGQNGIETLTYKITYTNGRQTDKTLVSTVVTAQPVTQIVEVGTYVAPAAPAPSAPAPSAQSCTPLSNEGTCYEPGEYCRTSDRGSTGVAGNGESIICEDNDGWRWEPN